MNYDMPTAADYAQAAANRAQEDARAAARENQSLRERIDIIEETLRRLGHGDALDYTQRLTAAREQAWAYIIREDPRAARQGPEVKARLIDKMLTDLGEK